jgi:hypothetical protein
MDEPTGGTKATIVELFDAPPPSPARPPLGRVLLATAAATSSGPRHSERAASNRRQQPPPRPTAPRRRLPRQWPTPRPTAPRCRLPRQRHHVQPLPAATVRDEEEAPLGQRRPRYRGADGDAPREGARGGGSKLNHRCVMPAAASTRRRKRRTV